MTGQRPGDTPRAVLSVSCRQSHNLNATATASATPLRLVSVRQRGVYRNLREIRVLKLRRV
jgi:hypothetical protein